MKRRLFVALIVLLMMFTAAPPAQAGCEWVIIDWVWNEELQDYEPVWEYQCTPDPPQWHSLNLIVTNAATGAPIAGAHVGISIDFGNGSYRYTDGGGFANFGVTAADVGYNVSAGGFHNAGGSVWTGGDNQLYVGLTRLPGRYRVGSNQHGPTCYYDGYDSGPDQCDPQQSVGTQPTANENTSAGDQGFTLTSGGAEQYTELLMSPQQAAIPSCRAYTKNGTAGWISVQVNPVLGALAWTARMHYPPADWGGCWKAWVLVNGQQRDSKSQSYPPHGSLPQSQAPSGSMVQINVWHIFYTWYSTVIYLGPEVGWRWFGSWLPQIVNGRLDCMMPFAGL